MATVRLYRLANIFATVAVLAVGIVSNADCRQYQDVAKALQDYQATKHSRLQERLNAPAYAGRSTVDIARELLQALPTNISEACGNQSTYLLGHLSSLWALQMLDSIGKPASGILEGNVVWLGDFDECNNAATSTDDQVSFTGRYCLLSLPASIKNQPLTLKFGACVPSGCSNNDTTALFNTALFLLSVKNTTGFSADCHLADRPYDNGTYVAIVVCSLFAVFLLAGTLYDVGKMFLSSIRTMEYAALESNANSLNKEIREPYENTPLLNGKGYPPDQRTSEQGLLEKVVLSFSFYTNGKKLLSTAQSDSALGCIHGIRFLSMNWVILGHAYVFTLSLLSDPANLDFLKRRSFQAIVNASVSVDSFFVLSGLLVTYILLKELDKCKGQLKAKEWVLIYVHRYIRLTAVYMLLLMVWTCLADRFYDGPQWPTSGSLDPSCTKYWWTNLIYINNFIPTENSGFTSCMGWSWYLANDMQFFLITPPIAYLMYRKYYIGCGLTALLVLGSVAAAAGVSVADSFGIGVLSGNSAAYFYEYYISPWCRFQTYGVGVLLGFILYKRKGKAKVPPVLVICGWIVAAVSCLAVLYGPYEASFGSRVATATIGEAAANNSLSRLAWSVGLAWVIFACCTNNGGFVNTLLSWKPFIPLGRLTYCAYLIHPILLTIAELGSRDLIHFDDVTMTLRFLGILVMSMALAFVASLAFEAPILGIEKLLLRPDKK